MHTRKPQVFATNLHKNALEHDGPRTQRWHFALARATIRGPKATICTTEATIRPRTDESNHAESTRASSNSAAENATRGPRCSVFFPGWQETRLWGLSGRLGVAEKARKRAAKREKRQESRQWGPERHAEPMQRGPLAAFPAILRAKPRNRRFPQRKAC